MEGRARESVTIIHRTLEAHSLNVITSEVATHPNPIMGPLINQSTTRRLRRRWTFDATQ